MAENSLRRWFRGKAPETDAERGRRKKIEAISLTEEQRRILEN